MRLLESFSTADKLRAGTEINSRPKLAQIKDLIFFYGNIEQTKNIKNRKNKNYHFILVLGCGGISNLKVKKNLN